MTDERDDRPVNRYGGSVESFEKAAEQIAAMRRAIEEPTVVTPPVGASENSDDPNADAEKEGR